MPKKKKDAPKKRDPAMGSWLRSYSQVQISSKNIGASFTHQFPAMEKHFFRV